MSLPNACIFRVLSVMPTPSRAQLQTHLERLISTGFAKILAQFSQVNDLPKTFFYAIASRETNCKNILGDVRDDGPHGVGIVQIDIQHPIARQARDSGLWKTNPVPLIEFGAKLLSTDMVQVKHILPNLERNDILKVTASGYNCGIARAIRTAGSSSGNSDSYTTGKDYGQDVLDRMIVFDQLLQ
jgi:hypothetical protein